MLQVKLLNALLGLIPRRFQGLELSLSQANPWRKLELAQSQTILAQEGTGLAWPGLAGFADLRAMTQRYLQKHNVQNV